MLSEDGGSHDDYQRFHRLLQQKQRVKRARQIDAENHRMSQHLRTILHSDGSYSYRTMKQGDVLLDQYRRHRSLERQRRYNLVQKQTLLPSYPKAKRKLRQHALPARGKGKRNGAGMAASEFNKLYSVRSADQLQDVAQLFGMTKRAEPTAAQKIVQAKVDAAAEAVRRRDPSQAKYRLSYIVPKHTNTARAFIESVRQARPTVLPALFREAYSIQATHEGPRARPKDGTSMDKGYLPSIVVGTASDGRIVIDESSTSQSLPPISPHDSVELRPPPKQVEAGAEQQVSKLNSESPSESDGLLERLRAEVIEAERSKNHHPLMKVIRLANQAGLSHRKEVLRATHLVRELSHEASAHAA